MIYLNPTKLKCLRRQTECTMPRSWLGKPQQSDSLFSPVVDQRTTADRLELTYLKLLPLTAALCFCLHCTNNGIEGTKIYRVYSVFYEWKTFLGPTTKRRNCTLLASHFPCLFYGFYCGLRGFSVFLFFVSLYRAKHWSLLNGEMFFYVHITY